MAVILSTDPIAEEGLQLLRDAGHEVQAVALDEAGLDAIAARAEGWIVRSGTQLDEAMLARAPRLRAIGRAGVGVDNIDLAAATRRGVAVFHAPTGNITSAAEQAWALMLAVARRTCQADVAMKQEEWARKRLKGVELEGKTLFIVGLGRIGAMMAKRAQAFGMTCTGYDPFVTPEAAKAMGVESRGLGEGMAGADFVTLHTPLTPQTRGLIDAAMLAKARPHAILVNAARGGLVDEAALLAALEADRLAGAGLDVWDQEPPTDWRLAKHPRVVAAPHLGASTAEAQTKAAKQACQRVADFLATGDAGLAVNASTTVDAKLRPWADLAQQMAGFLAQTVTGNVEEVGVGAGGGLPADALQVHALIGALRASADEAGTVNAINAPGSADARGWSVAHRAIPDKEPFVRIVLRTDEGQHTIEGVWTPHYGGRVTAMDGFDLEFRPQGRFLTTRHEDVPGVLAAITAALAAHQVNVASVALARRPEGAAAVIQVDDSLPKALRDAVRALPHMREAHRVRVGVGR